MYTKERQMRGKPCFSFSLHKNKGIGVSSMGKTRIMGWPVLGKKQIKLSQARLSPSYFPSESSSLQRALTRSRYSCFVVCFLPSLHRLLHQDNVSHQQIGFAERCTDVSGQREGCVRIFLSCTQTLHPILPGNKTKQNKKK